MIVTNKLTNGVTLSAASAIENISLLAEALHALCLYASNSESCAHDVELAAVEALNNVVLHAYKNQPDKDITVKWYKENRRLRIEIIDYGISISSLSPAVLPSFDAEGGRGWWIINACVDQYFYKVVEYIERNRVYNPDNNGDFLEDIIKSHHNVLTLIKQF